ncbi:lipase family alpha/beta hydrolase [Leptospira idonii]|uniref:GPI inositol-deacylase PGAP1-like alpha/beta domain-containing protein n=1 Tax=Leptospira idonii TaxID=1193500 RepID=A0A4V3JXS8_9LEPT|nr:hypothetical protein [Leptospira idonii]TGN18586.1 hypothetical protein EHS15_14485 [Leptospira idonii]
MKPSFFFFLLLLLFSTNQCIYDFYRKEFLSDKKESDKVLLLSLVDLAPNPNQKLFYFVPGFNRNLPDEQFVDVAFAPQNSKPKLVFIHGWNPAERDADPTTGDTKKKTNIKSTFLNGIIHFQENQKGAKDKYDLYLYTYRTSNGILLNGRNFVKTLKSTFSVSDKVIVVAHSMGGLVTRSGMISPEYLPFLIDGVVTLASPQFGSPFASSAFLSAYGNIAVSELGSYLISTQGGQDLSHTNVGAGQSQIPDAKNQIIDLVNEGFGLNSIFISYSGILSGCTGQETIYYQTACNTLVSSNLGFNRNDGVVPENSALLGGLSKKGFTFTGYDHSMMAFQTINVNDAKSINLFQAVIDSADELVSSAP